MDVCLLLSHQQLFRTIASPEAVFDLLRGVSLDSLVGFCSGFCHATTACLQETGDHKAVIAHQPFMIRNLVPPPLKDEILNLVSHRNVYRGRDWVLSSNHHMAILTGAYFRMNPRPKKTMTSRGDFDRLTRALLMINDLSTSEEGDNDDLVATSLFVHTLNNRTQGHDLIPRSCDIFCNRLCQEFSGLAGAFEERYGVRPEEFSGILHVLYAFFAAQLMFHKKAQHDLINEFSHGLIRLSDVLSSHRADEAIRLVIQSISATPDSFSNAFRAMDFSNPSILPFLENPIIDTGDDLVWCPDPYLLISAAGPGMFWRLKRLYEERGKRPLSFFEVLGRPVFEKYVRELVDSFGVDPTLGDQYGHENEEISDIVLWEPPSLVLMELKAKTMKENVKWSGDPGLIKSEVEDLLSENQLMRAAERAMRTPKSPWLKAERVIPVIVVLDPSFATPGVEPFANTLIQKPDVGVPIEDLHLLTIADLEHAAEYFQNRAFASLLDTRRTVAPNGQFSLHEVIWNYGSRVRKSCGGWWPPSDPLAGMRLEFESMIKKVKARFDSM